MQNAAQGFHWNNQQSTIYPFVVYYKNEEGELLHYTFIVISDCLQHDAVAVYLCIEKLMHFLKSKFNHISKIYYFTDGAPSHYKNKKNFMNIMKHKKNFGIDCEWHLHATSHGKGPCDGVGGTIKRMAARASFTNEHIGGITTPKELHQWAETFKTNMKFAYFTVEEHNTTNSRLDVSNLNLKTIKGTQGYHAFIPSDDGYIICKKYSISEAYDKIKFL